MFLIEEQLYEKILPLLSEIDRQELVNLNEEHQSNEQSRIEGFNNDTPNKKIDQIPSAAESPAPVLISSTEALPNTDSKDEPNENLSVQRSSSQMPPKPLIPTSMESSSVNSRPHLTPSRKPMRPKKFECKICSKGFTTRFSLKRHNEKFHSSSLQDNKKGTEISQKADKEIEVKQKPVRISKYSNRILKRKYQQAPEISEEETDNTYQKMPRIRGVKRTKKLSSSNPDATDNKQMRYESGMTESDYYAPRGVKRQIKRAIDSRPNKKVRWVNF